MSKTNERYTGHNVTGGLQQHSTGPEYPWTVIAQGDLCPPEYRAYNCVTQQQGPLRSCCRQAHDDAAQYSAQHRLVQAVTSRPAKTTWHGFTEAEKQAACAPRASSNYHEIPLASGKQSTGPRVGPRYTLTLADAIKLGHLTHPAEGNVLHLAVLAASPHTPEQFAALPPAERVAHAHLLLSEFPAEQVRHAAAENAITRNPVEVAVSLVRAFGE